ncbi:MAG: isoaspartyl peptidase/L-asparaginase [Phenylobacterium sp.]
MAGSAEAAPKWAIAVHGGAGVISRDDLTKDQEAAYRDGLEEAARAGGKVLERGGSALDAVEAAVRVLEDNPLFNAGKGAVFTADGHNQLDAAIMDGRNLKAGAVTGVMRTKNPISLARKVMEDSPHVMLSGEGADAFARQEGLQQVDPSYFFTETRWKSLLRALDEQGLPEPKRPAGAGAGGPDKREGLAIDEGRKHGTVGAVAVDIRGDVAAATSTGGLTAKRWGRIGDSPIIGAGTYASNDSCAVSGTGAGEYFIRLTVARTVCALVEMKKMKLQDAVDEVVHKRLEKLGGDGGVIAVTPDRKIAWSFNTRGMYRARLEDGGKLVTGIYKDDP